MRTLCRTTLPAILAVFSAATAPVVAADHAMIAYGSDADYSPRYRTWDGSDWSSASSANDVGGKPLWLVLRGSPISSGQYVMGVLDAGSDINVQSYDGSSWSIVSQVTTSAETYEGRCFDMAFEHSSGEALLVYKESSSSSLRYRTFDGSSWSTEQSYSLGDGSCDFLRLVPNPASDEIIVLEYDSSGHDIEAAVWNGSSFGNSYNIGSGGSGSGSSNTAPVSGAYESQSGTAIITYLDSSSSTPDYRTWNGSSWSSEMSMPSVGGSIKWLEMAADPASDKILFGCLDGGEDVNVNDWSGSSWGTDVQIESSTYASDYRGFDLAFEKGGTEALVVYETGSTSLRYRTWNGSAWSSESTGPSASEVTNGFIQTMTGLTSGQVFVAFTNNDKDVRAVTWDGSSFGSVQMLGTQSDNPDYNTFMIATSGSDSGTVTIRSWQEVER